MKLKTSKIIYVGFAFLIISLFWQVYDNIVVKMLVNSFGFNQFWSGVVMALDNVLAIFLLPLFGALSDKTNTKRGRRTPYILWGVIISAVLMTGIALFDSFQQNAVQAASISNITSQMVSDGGEMVKKFVFNGNFFDTNEAAIIARSAEVMQVTMNNILYLVAFIGVLLLVLVAMASYRTPAVALMPDITPKPLRSKANAIINLMGAAGGIAALGLTIFFAKDFESYVPLFILVSILMLVLLVVFMTTVNEKKLVEDKVEEVKKFGLEEELAENEALTEEKMSPDVRRSFYLIMLSIIFWFMAYNAATTKFSIYSQAILDMGFSLPLMIAQGAAILSYIPIGMLSSKFGRKKTIITGIAILTFAFFLGFIATEKTKVLIYFTMALAGIGWATINVNSYPMVVEMSKGSNVGKYTGYYYTASMFAQIITPLLSGLLMDMVGYKSLFPYSIVFCIFAFVTMQFVKHGDSKPIPKHVVEDLMEVD